MGVQENTLDRRRRAGAIHACSNGSVTFLDGPNNHYWNIPGVPLAGVHDTPTNHRAMCNSSATSPIRLPPRLAWHLSAACSHKVCPRNGRSRLTVDQHTSTEINASELMWQRFQRYRLLEVFNQQDLAEM